MQTFEIQLKGPKLYGTEFAINHDALKRSEMIKSERLKIASKQPLVMFEITS